jgi:hypothetical protein
MLHHSPHPYPASQYDDEMCLKAPLPLWLAILYLSRAITLPIAMAIGHVAGVDDRAIAQFRGFWSVYGLLPSLIAAVILVTLLRRTPAAPDWMRWVWARGRGVLAVAAILDMILLMTADIRQQGFELSLGSIAAALFDGCLLVYILAVRRVRDVFAEFPLPLK